MIDNPFDRYVVIDPKSQEFKRIVKVAQPGDGYRCLIAQYGRLYLPKSARPFAEYSKYQQVIRVSWAGKRWERDMDFDNEIYIAHSFDTGRPITREAIINFNVEDGDWRDITQPRRPRNAAPKDPNRKVRSDKGTTHKKQRQQFGWVA